MIIGPHSYDKLNDHSQPCQQYKPNPDDISIFYGDGYPQAHCCPRCEHEDAYRFNCGNCRYDHHSNGWTSCKPTEYYIKTYLTPKEGGPTP